VVRVGTGAVPDAKIHVVPNVLRAHDIRFSEPGRMRVRGELGIPPDAFTVGCVSRFDRKKRNDVVVDAVARLDGGAHLVLAGAGETEADLRRRASALGGRAHFVPTPGEEVVDYLSAFDVLVFCPSPTEGAPRSVLLGMLTSRACIATAREGVSEMLHPGRGEITRPENDPDALAAALVRYRDDPDRTRREGEAARRWVEATHAAPVVAEQIESVLAGERATRA
jgi:glycosyltransferase involved in cell wall biosynthesis